MLLDELAHLIDRLQAVRVALVLRGAPREQSVAAEQDAVASGVLHDGAAEHHAQLEARTLPRHPDDAPAVSRVQLVEFSAAVGARRQGNRPVRVQMIDVVERQERVQRRIDRRGDAILAEGAERIERDHLVFVRFAPVARDQLFELVQIQHGEPGRRPSIEDRRRCP